MAYWTEWDASQWKIPLSPTWRRQLLDENRVAALLDQGYDPIQLSYIKWVLIEAVVRSMEHDSVFELHQGALNDAIGYKTCALCIVSKQKYLRDNGVIRFGNDKCKVCPLAPIDCCTREGSVYSRIESFCLIGAGHEPLQSLIDKMIVNIAEANRTTHGAVTAESVRPRAIALDPGLAEMFGLSMVDSTKEKPTGK